jgi:hypothetical protein
MEPRRQRQVGRKKKRPKGGSLNSRLIIPDKAAINTGFDFPR